MTLYSLTVLCALFQAAAVQAAPSVVSRQLQAPGSDCTGTTTVANAPVGAYAAEDIVVTFPKITDLNAVPFALELSFVNGGQPRYFTGGAFEGHEKSKFSLQGTSPPAGAGAPAYIEWCPNQNYFQVTVNGVTNTLLSQCTGTTTVANAPVDAYAAENIVVTFQKITDLNAVPFALELSFVPGGPRDFTGGAFEGHEKSEFSLQGTSPPAGDFTNNLEIQWCPNQNYFQVTVNGVTNTLLSQSVSAITESPSPPPPPSPSPPPPVLQQWGWCRGGSYWRWWWVRAPQPCPAQPLNVLYG